jgi:hypothetical protein
MAVRKKNTAGPSEMPVPMFCDFSCPHADFSSDVSGACRREQVVYCRLKKKYNNKNKRCLVRAQSHVGS